MHAILPYVITGYERQKCRYEKLLEKYDEKLNKMHEKVAQEASSLHNSNQKHAQHMLQSHKYSSFI